MYRNVMYGNPIFFARFCPTTKTSLPSLPGTWRGWHSWQHNIPWNPTKFPQRSENEVKNSIEVAEHLSIADRERGPIVGHPPALRWKRIQPLPSARLPWNKNHDSLGVILPVATGLTWSQVLANVVICSLRYKYICWFFESFFFQFMYGPWLKWHVVCRLYRFKCFGDVWALEKRVLIWSEIQKHMHWFEGPSHSLQWKLSSMAWKAKSRPWISSSPTSFLDLVPFLSFEAVAVGKCREWSSFLSICKKSSAEGNGGWYWCLGHGWVNEASIKTESIDSIRR